MEKAHCQNRHYYVRHYAIDNRRIFRVHWGHCTLDRIRLKQPGAEACGGFCPGSPQQDAFVSKEYLSKELLQYMLRLELLPEIGEPEGVIK